MIGTKSFYYIISGCFGIIKNPAFNVSIKLIFLCDYFILLIKLFLTYFFKKKYTSVYIKAFRLKITFPSYYTFFYIFNEIFCIGVYPKEKDVITYFDIGANIGISILWYRLFNPNMKIVAFEPDVNNLYYLKQNLKLNHIENVTIYPVCLANKVGEADFYLVDDPIQNLNSGLVLNRKFLPYSIKKVKVDKLSKYITKDKISLIKMDVEGAEYDIFKDLISSNKIRLINKIIFEAHYYNKQQIIGYKKYSKKLQSIGKLTSFKNSEFTTANYFQKNLMV